jgi:hypothetical protein
VPFAYHQEGWSTVSNVLESGNSQEGGPALLTRLRLLRYAYQSGLFAEPTAVSFPEIVADGQGPDNWIGGSPDAAVNAEERCRPGSAFRPAPDVEGRPFCRSCGVLRYSFRDGCPVCGTSWSER